MKINLIIKREDMKKNLMINREDKIKLYQNNNKL